MIWKYGGNIVYYIMTLLELCDAERGEDVMVTFRLISKTDREVLYEYYPEDEKDSSPGLIEIDIEENTIEVIKMAECDSVRIIEATELNAMRGNIDSVRGENGEASLSEDELPTATEDCKYYRYASYVISKISEAYNRGIILENGMAMWY